MDAGEIKAIRQLMRFAQRLGAKRFSCSGFEIEFHAADAIPPRHRGSVEASPQAEAGNISPPAPTAAEMLDKINEHIYGKNDDAMEPLHMLGAGDH